ncbi:DNA-binding transcriptional regulator, LysR family [Actinomadura meyerae]|uniref:DNA-binding transcriptional regulator, LysR family n=1 Tax=Actinomadura meyerae TaxID=240840 RepID=A0A239BW36_9ACTN|nr:LysR family transcriptional regulator [Actinomadura meyerae]SNS11661.1 DNA-binding transcriptional regulator, LysR family [Actinomadura meyerae]
MDLSRLSTDALASFAVFAEHLNFTRAADELHISQPALHVKVRKLSETLGRPLYTRHGRRLALTPAGEQVARFARDLDARVSAFLDAVHGTAASRVPTLAAGEGAYLYLLGDAVRPGIRLINGDRARTLTAVRTGRADVGVAVLDVLPADVATEPLASYPQTLVMPDDHPLAARDGALALADLAGADLIVPPPAGPHRVLLERALRAAEVPWTLAVEAEGWPLMLHFVALRIGLAVVNGCVPPPPGLTAREIIDLPAVPYYALHLPDRAGDPVVTGLLATVRTAVRSTPCTSRPPSTSPPPPRPSGSS